MQSIRYKSSDGLEIPAYLTLPKGVPGKSLPTLVIPHGGPWTRDVWGFNPLAQLFANRGYAVLMPNFRGSTGYGKKFLNAGNGEWGRKMQDDLTWGVKYLIAEGHRRPEARGHPGLRLWRIRRAGRRCLHSGPVPRGRRYRRGPSNLLTMLGCHSGVLGSASQNDVRSHGRSGTPEGIAWLKERSPFNQIRQDQEPR